MAEAAFSALFDGAQAHNKKCEVCGEVLVPKQGRAKFCSRACSRVVENQKRTEMRREAGVSVIIGEPFPCKICGAEVTARSPKSRYCDDCRAIARLETFRKSNSRPERKEKTKKRLRTDKKYALDRRMGWGIWDSLKNKKSGRRWEDVVGYGLSELSEHLEKQFLPGMSWENFGEWHIDHIRPRASFEYSSEHCAAFRECWSLTNLRPLWSEENIKKGSKRLHLI